MSKSDKSVLESENVSMLRFPVSPNFFSRTANPRPESNAENNGPRSPLFGQFRLPRVGSLSKFASPYHGHANERLDSDLVPLSNLPFDANIEGSDRPVKFGGQSAGPFSPLLSIPTVVSPPLPVQGSLQVVTHSKMIFNPLKTQNSPVDKNFIIQDSALAKTPSHLTKVFSFSLKRFNSFERVLRGDEESAQPDGDNPGRGIALGHRGIRKLKKKFRQRHRRLLGSGRGRKRVLKCNCKNSTCMKDYCECFRNGDACGSSCKCRGCKNGQRGKQAPKQRAKGEDAAFAKPSDKVPRSVHKALTQQGALGAPASRAHGEVRCNCKKSMCAKKYCECFSIGAFCTSNCNCQQCRNGQALPTE